MSRKIRTAAGRRPTVADSGVPAGFVGASQVGIASSRGMGAIGGRPHGGRVGADVPPPAKGPAWVVGRPIAHQRRTSHRTALLSEMDAAYPPPAATAEKLRAMIRALSAPAVGEEEEWAGQGGTSGLHRTHGSGGSCGGECGACGAADCADSAASSPGGEPAEWPGGKGPPAWPETDNDPDATLVARQPDPADALAECLEAAHFCWFGACAHPGCPRLLSGNDLALHLARAHADADKLARYLDRVAAAAGLDDGVLRRACGLVRRLRAKLESGTAYPRGTSAPASTDRLRRSSTSWGTHYLVMVVSCMLARKFAEDGRGPPLRVFAEAGGFPVEAVRTAEREMLEMLDYGVW